MQVRIVFFKSDSLDRYKDLATIWGSISVLPTYVLTQKHFFKHVFSKDIKEVLGILFFQPPCFQQIDK